MRNTPSEKSILIGALTIAEARAACKECQHLTGSLYYEAGQVLGIIKCVAVSPRDAINKWIFLNYYADCKDAGRALTFYRVPYFDVILIILRNDNHTLIYRDLAIYIREMGRKQ